MDEAHDGSLDVKMNERQFLLNQKGCCPPLVDLLSEAEKEINNGQNINIET